MVTYISVLCKNQAPNMNPSLIKIRLLIFFNAIESLDSDPGESKQLEQPQRPTMDKGDVRSYEEWMVMNVMKNVCDIDEIRICRLMAIKYTFL